MSQHLIPRPSAPPVMLDHRLWRNRRRLDQALSGIFEVRELPDLTLAGFSSWTEDVTPYWAHVLFNRRHQLLSVQLLDENEMDNFMLRGISVWKITDRALESPTEKLRLECADLLTG